MPRFSLKLPQSKPLRLVLVAIPLLLAAGGGWLWYTSGRITDAEARVQGHLQLLAPGVAGRVAEVLVSDNQTVQSGQELIRLEDAGLKVALAEARARLEAARHGVSPAFADPVGSEPSASRSAEQALLANIETARKEETEARREVEHRTAVHAQMLLEVRRLDALPGGGQPGGNRRDQRDRARLAEIEARGAMESARDRLSAMSRSRAATEADLRRFRQELGKQGRTAMPGEMRTRQLELLEARVAEAEHNLAEATLTAAEDGRIERLSALPGLPVRKGELLGVVVPTRPEHLWISMRVPESRAAEVEPGMPCVISVPGGPEIEGVVESILPPEVHVPDLTTEQVDVPASGALIRILLLKQDAEAAAGLRIGMRTKATILIRAAKVPRAEQPEPAGQTESGPPDPRA